MSTITEILGTDNITDSRAVINTNFSNLNTDKLEASDIANFETTTQLNARDTANRNRANHTGTQTASTISDFDTEVSNNTDVSANTSARHTHSNKTILDNTTASFTTAQETKLSNTSGINTGDNATNTQYSGLATSKQDTLVSGTNIKTVNSQSLLGSGDITITGTGHTIQDEGTPLTTRANLNFVGAGVTVIDDSGNNATKVTITTGGDMLKSTYDTDNNGIVDNSERLGGELPSFFQQLLVSGTNIKTVNGNTLLGSGDITVGTGDMLLGTVQEVTAEKKFDKDTLTTKGTSTGKTIISTANTSATDYTATLPAKTGTIAMTSDINRPTTTVDNTIARYDGTTGLLQSSTPTIDDNGNLTATSLNASANNSTDGNLAVITNTASTNYSRIKYVGTTNSFTSGVGNDSAVITDLQNKFYIYDITNTKIGFTLVPNTLLAKFYGNLETVGNIELGNASDTTISRVSAGKIAVEGVNVVTVSSTDTLTNKTLTSPTLTTPVLGTPASGTLTNCTGLPVGGITQNTGKLLGRNTAGSGVTEEITLGTGLSFSGTTLNASGGGSYWTDIPGTPTRTGNTTFTVTGDYTSLLKKGLIIKWTESSTVKCGMVISSSYGSPNTTVTIIGDTMASIDSSSAKYTFESPFIMKFATAGGIAATGTDVMNGDTCIVFQDMRVIGADMSVGTVASTSGNTVIDINKNGTTMFTAKPTLAYNARYTTSTYTADNGSAITLGDEITIDIDTVTSTTFPVDLYVYLFTFPTFKLSLT